MSSTTNTNLIMEQIAQLKRRILPNDRLILFGSRARGDAREDSDWDLLVLLNKQAETGDDYDNYGYPFTELGWTLGAYFSPKIYTTKEWQQRHVTPFYQNIEREGVEIK
jgi:predicted nucleotidyltransferase